MLKFSILTGWPGTASQRDDILLTVGAKAGANHVDGQENTADRGTGGPSVVPVTEGRHEGQCWQWERRAVRGSAGRGKVCLILSATVGNDERTRILKIGQEISGKFYVRGGPELRLFKALKTRKEYLAYFHLPVIKNKNTKCTT